MSTWSLSTILEGLHDEIQLKLETSRKAFGHPGAKGDATEAVWLELFNRYLPERYSASRAFVVDSKGVFSDQIDVVIYDRQYSPFIFEFKDQTVIPAESVYAVFESKQSINAEQIQYAMNKIQTVRTLYRTSLPIPHAGGVFPAKMLIPIYGGILTFESDWKSALGKSLQTALEDSTEINRVEMGCVAAHGHFYFNKVTGKHEIMSGDKSATSFLFNLISILQFSGTVPMIDILAYSSWLSKPILVS